MNRITENRNLQAGDWFPAPPPGDEIFVIYSIGAEKRQEWPAELLDYSFQMAKQPGTLIRLVSGSHQETGRSTPCSAAGHTLVTPNYSDAMGWPVMNKLGSLRYLFENLDPEFKERNRQSILIFLDPDMIFTHPWNPSKDVGPGHVHGQRWIGYGKEYCLKSSIHTELCPSEERDCIMYPFAITLGDMNRIATDIECHGVEGFRKCGDWMTDMTAFVTAMVKHDLKVTTAKNIGVCNTFDSRDDETAPILHYCQRMYDSDGIDLWHKSYRAWDPVPDASRATNRVDREVLTHLSRLRQIKMVLSEALG